MTEVIQLGQHRLLCGDATNKEDVTKLIGNHKVNLLLTDPPYGIDIVKTNTTLGGGGNQQHSGKVGHQGGPSITPFKTKKERERERESITAQSEDKGDQPSDHSRGRISPQYKYPSKQFQHTHTHT